MTVENIDQPRARARWVEEVLKPHPRVRLDSPRTSTLLKSEYVFPASPPVIRFFWDPHPSARSSEPWSATPIKFTGLRGFRSPSAHSPPGRPPDCALTVVDTRASACFPEQARQISFKPFTQADSTRTRQISARGTGLGRDPFSKRRPQLR